MNTKQPHRSQSVPGRARAKRSSLMLALEQRVMFDGAVVATAAQGADALHAAVESAREVARPHEARLQDGPGRAVDLARTAVPAEPAREADRKEVVFVDTSVADYQMLVAGMKDGVEVVLLDRSQDGVAQMAAWAQSHSGYDAIHVVSHGNAGRVLLGTAKLDAQTVPGYGEALRQIGASLTAGGDILLYGCDVGSDARGAALLASIADATGADVAASTDATGATAAGGDGVLEARFGTVTATSAVRYDTWEAYGDVLAQSFSSGTVPLTDFNTSNINFIQVADVDNDGDIDILTQEGGAATAVTLWSNNGSGSYTSSTAIATGVTGLNISAVGAKFADFDNDGDLDYYQWVSGATNDIYYTNDGSGGFTSGTVPLTDFNTSNINFMQVADVDNDGDIDILTQEGGSATAVTLWANNGSGSFTSSAAIATGVTGLNISASGAKLADFDNDGDLDYYQWVSGASNDLYYTNNGSGGFSSGTVPLTDFNTANINFMQVADVDNDGDTDILTQVGGSATAVTLWTNDGSGGFTSSTAIATGVTGLNISAIGAKFADFDNDGDLDYYQWVNGASNDLFYRNDNAPPTLTSFTPSANGAVNANDNLVLTFSHSSTLSKGSGTISIRIDDGDGNYANDTVFESFAVSDARVSLSGNSTASTVTINPNGSFVSGVNYYVVMGPTTFVDADSKGFVTKVSNRFHSGLPDPAIKRAGNSLDPLADRTVMSFIGANSTPVIGSLGGDSVAWAGVGSSVTLDSGGDATASDAELGLLNSGNGNWSGASLMVRRSVGAVSTDVFGFNTSGALFTVSGSNLQSGGLTFATYTNTGGTLTISFTSSGTAATTALVQDLMRHITYRSDTPAGDATIRFSLSDGNTTATADTTVTSDTIYITNTTDTATIDVTNGVSFSEAVAIAAADGTGSQTLIFTSSFTGSMSLAGNLSIAESLTLNADSANGLSLNGSTITLGSGTTLSFTNASGTVTIASTLAGSGSLSKAGSSGTLALTSSSNEANMSGGITVTAGTLQISNDDYLSSGTLTLNGGTLTNNSAAYTLDNAIAIGASGGTLNVGGGGGATQMNISGVISGSGTLIKNGQAILQLDGNNTFTGSMSITAGTVIANHANAFGTTASSTTVASGSSVRVNGGLTIAEAFTVSGTGKTVSAVDYGALHLVSGSSTLSGNIAFTGDTNIGASSGATLTLSGALSGGAYNLNKTDAGTVVLSNSGNEAGLTGGTTVTAGTLSVANDDYLAAGTITLNGGTLAITGATTIDNAVTLPSASTISTTANATLSGALSGANPLTKSGASTLTLAGTSSAHFGAVNVTVGGLTLSGGSALGDTSAVTLSSGTTLTVSSTETIGSLAGAGSVVLNAGLTAGGDNSSTTYSGVISGTFGLTKAGSGTLTLTGNNLYTGATTVSAGGLTLNRVGGALDDNTSISVASGATLTVSADETIDNLSGAGTVALGTSALTIGINGSSSTFSGGITGSGTLTLDGSGTFTLSGTNSGQSWSMQVLSGGTVAIAGDANLGTGTLQLNDGTLSVTSAATVDNAITLGASSGTVSVGSGLAVGLSGAIGGAGALTKTGSGTLTLSGSNNYSGTTTVSAGTLAVAADGNLGAAGVSLAAGSTLQVTGATTIDNALTLNGAATLLIDAAVTASGAIGGSGSLTKTGTGNLTLSSSSSNYSGGTTLTAGTVTAQNAASIGSGTITFNGGALTVDSASATFANAVTMVAGGTLGLTSGSTATFNGAFSGTGALAVTGVSGGGAETLVLGNTGNSASWSGDLAATDATVQFAGDNQLAAGSITLNAGAQLTASATTTVDNAIAIAGAATLYASTGTLTVSGVVSGSAALTSAGGVGATVLLSGTNTHTGSINVTSATLGVSGGSAIDDASAVTLSNGSTLSLQANETIGSLASGSGNALSLGSNRLTVGGDNTSTTYSGSISGTGGLTKIGTGTWTLGGTNTASGTVLITAGGLTVSGGSAIGNSSAVTVDSGATLTLSATETIGSLAGAGTVALGSATLSSGSTNASTTFSGAINGSGNLTKTGTGKLTLSGTNGYTGTTTVSGSGGTLSIAGTSNISSNTITLGSGGVLEVTGSNVTLTNAFTISTGGGKVSNDNALTLAGVVAGASGASFNKLGSGVLTMSAANTLAGNTVVTAGTLMLTGSLTATNSVSVLSGATLAGTGTITTANSVVIASGAFLSPGNGGAGTLTINGDLAMFGTLQVDINGTTAGTGYDQIVVNGDVTLDFSGAALTATHGYTPGLADSYIIIDNDGSDAIVDTFAGLSEGGTLTAAGNGTVLTASYIGGDSNDFTLTAPTNSTPVVTNLDGDSAAYTPGSTVVLDVAGNATVSDAEDDAGNWNGGSLVVQRVTGGTADPSANDVLGFDLTGALFTVSGSNLQDGGGLTFATFTNTGGVLTVSFTGSGTAATTALVQSVMRSINYRNDTPYGDATVRFALTDSMGATADSDVTLTCSAIYVDQGNDDAGGDAADGFSLREALARGAAQAGADTIYVVLADNTTITLGSGVTSGAGDTLALDGANGLVVTGSTLTLGGALTIDNGSGDTATISSTLAGSATLTKTGAGTLALTSSGNEAGYSGAIAINGGTLSVDSDDALGSGALQLDGGTFRVSTGSTTIDNDMAFGSGGGTLEANVDWTASGVFSGSGTLSKTGLFGILTLSGTSTHTGITSLGEGILAVGSDANLGTGTLELYGGTFSVNTTGQTIDNAISVTSRSGAIELGSGIEATLSGLISGTGDMHKSGSGSLTLTNTGNSATNWSFGQVNGKTTVTSADQIGGGTLKLAGGTLAIDASSSFTLDRTTQVISTVAIDATGSNTGAVISLGGLMSGSGALSLDAGDSQIYLSQADNLAGNLTISSSGSGLVAAIGTGTLGSGQINLTAGATLGVAGSSRTIGNDIILQGDATLRTGAPAVSADTITFTGVISESGGARNLTVNAYSVGGNHTDVVLSGINTYTGTTTLLGGTLSVASDANLGAGAINLGGGILAVTGSTTIDNDVAVNGAATLRIDAAATLSGVLSGSGVLTKAGTATLGLTGTQTHSGNLAVTAGAVSVADDANLGSGAISLNGGTLVLTGATTIDNAISIGGGGATIQADAAATLSGVLSGSGALQKTGTEMLTLTGTQTHSGTTEIAAGTLSVADDANLGSGDLTLSGGTLDISGATTIDNAIVVAAASVIQNAAAATLSGVLSGNGGLSKSGAGTLTLSATQTHTGTTTIQAGTLSIAGDANVGSGDLILAGGTLAVTGATTIDNAVVLTSASTLQADAAVTLSGALSGGAFTLSKTGSAALTLTNTANHAGLTGGVEVSAGTLAVSDDSALMAGTVTLAAGTTLRVGGVDAVVDNAIVLSGDATIATDAAVSSNGVTFSGNISETGGSHTLTLAADASNAIVYSGSSANVAQTTLTTGTLRLAGGTFDQAVTINSATRLEGTGAVYDLVVAGVLAPGVGTGGTARIDVNHDLTLASGAEVQVDLGGPVASTSYDQINVTGALDLSGGTLTINSNAYAPVAGDSFQIFAHGGAGAITAFPGIAQGALIAYNGEVLHASYTAGDGNDFALTANSAPVLDASDSPALNGVLEDIGVPSNGSTANATLVSSLVDIGGALGNVSDADGSALGIAITGLSGLGTLYYSTDGGANWTQATGLSASSALLLAADASTWVYFRPDAEVNGSISDALTIKAWDRSSGTAGTSADTTTGDRAFSTATDTVAIAVTAVNDAPVLTPAAPTLTGIDEDATTNAGQTVASILGSSVTDVDPDTAGIAIEGLVSGNGTWQYSLDGGTSWSAVGTVSANSALLLRSTDLVRFVPNGVNGTSASFDYRAWDASAGTAGNKVDASVTGGTTAFSTAGDTASITVGEVNDAPTLSATGGSPTFTENGSAVDLFSGVTIGTVETGQSITELVLTVGNVLDGASEVLTIDGSDVALTDGNSVTTTTNGMTVTVSLSGATATVTIGKVGGIAAASAETLVDGITYRNDSEAPSTASARTVTLVSLSDDGGTTAGGVDTGTLSVAATVTVEAVNDAPVITAPASIAVTEDVSSVLSGISFADVDADTGSVTVTLTVGSGSLAATSGGGVTVGGSATALTLSGTVADINAFIAANGVSFTTAADATADVTLGVAIDDGGNTGTGGALTDSASVTLDVTAVNDAPTITAPASIAVTEDVSSVLSGISFADVDADTGSVTVTLTVGSGSLAATSGGGVTVGGSATALTLSGTVADINAFIAANGVSFTTAADATADVTLGVAIDDGGNTGSGGALTDSATVTLTVDAVNDAPVITAPATIVVTEDVAAALTGISFSDVDAGSGNVTVTLTVGSGSLAATSGGGVTVGGTATALTLSGTVADINAFIAANGVSFTTAADATADVTLGVAIDDGGNTGTGGALTDSASITLDVTAVNDAPTITAPASIAVTEDVSSVLSGISFADVDAGSGNVTVTLTVGSGSLAATSGGGVTVGGSATALTLSGTVADINAFIAANGVSFTTAADATADVALGVAIDDGGNTGTGGALTGSTSITLDVTAVNDAPTITAPASIAVTEDVAAALTGISFADVDAGSGNVTVTLTVGSGSLSATSGGGVTVGGSATALTLSGTVADINAFIAANGVSFTTAADATADVTLGVAIDDGGNTGTGGALTDSTSITLDVTAVNDAPTITAPASIAVTEDVSSVLSGISFADVDAGSGNVTVTLTVGSGSLSAISGGGVTVGGSATALTLSGTVADINAFIAANGVSFTTAADATADVTLGVAIDDGGNTGSGGALTNSTSITLDVTAVNDAPTITAPASIAVTEDVAAALTGISFSDVDAGSGNVTVTLTVGSGSLSATSGGGVTVGGSATALTLSGTVADINAFIAANGVSFTTAADATADVTLGVAIDDGGNTGTGGALSDSASVTLTVDAVNDAPLNTVPVAQSTDQDLDLVFSSANGNLISVGDVDAGTGIVRVTLTADNGLIALSGTNGLSFLVGSGANDGTMVFEGTLADINAALDGLVFTPTAGYHGAASLEISTDDLGLTGSGGAQTDTDVIAITVDALNPTITTVHVGNADGSYKVGDVITVTLTFDQAIDVDTSGGTPTLLLETGATDRVATYLSGSGSNTLTFSYTVQAGDSSADLDYASTAALALNGGTIRNGAGDDASTLLPATGGAGSIAGQHDIVIDGVAPTVATVDVPAAATYTAGETLSFTVHYGEAVTVDTSGGVPRIAIDIGGTTVYASYVSGSGGTDLVFSYVVTTGVQDGDGPTVGGSLDLNGGTIRDLVGNDADTALAGIGDTSGVLIDAVAPVVADVTVPADGQYNAGDVLTFTVDASEAVTVDTSGGTPRLVLDIGGVTRYATYVSGSGGSSLVFQYIVQPGDSDTDGIAVGSTLDLNGGTVADAAGNAIDPALGSVPAAGVLIDTDAPAASGIVRVDPTPTGAASVSYTVTFSEDVTGVDTTDFTLVGSGSAAGSIASITQLDAHTYTVLVTGLSGSGTLRLDLNASGTGIADVAGNAIAGGLAGEAYTIDRIAPVVTGVGVPADATYVAGQNLDFTVDFDEAVLVDTAGGTPRLAVTLDTGGTVYASYVGGSGGTTLTFRLTVASGQLDADGIALGASLDLNGATVRDALGNDAVAALNGVPATGGILVDAVAPAIASVTVPADSHYNAGEVLTFTLNTSEAVTLDTSGGTPRLVLDVGGVTRYASYVSGSGSSSLVFQYTVQPGDNDADGIAVGASLDLDGATARDAAGNDLALSLGSVPSTAGVLVDTLDPNASGIVRVDPNPTNANSVSYTVTFSEDVTGVDAADFALVATGSVAGNIASVVQVDARTYTVLVNGVTGAGTLRLDLNASGTGIMDVAGNTIAGGLAGEDYTFDRTAPAVTAVGVPADAIYGSGQDLDFTVDFDEAVVVDTAGGTPRIAVTLDTGGTVYASYVGGSGSATLTFRLTVAAGQLDADGIALGGSVDLNGATLRDLAGNDAAVALNGVPATGGILVDGVAPTVASVAVPADSHYNAGDVLTFTVGTSEAVTLDTSGGTPRLVLNIGGVTRYASYVSGSGGSSLVFQYVVAAGDNDADGIAVGASLDLDGATVRDAAGNDLALSLGSVPSTAGVLVDTVAPDASGIVRGDPSPTNAGSVSYTVTFSEDVTGVDAADFALVSTGSAAGSIASVVQVDARTYTVLVNGLAGSGTLRLDLNASGTGIADAAGNAVAGGLAGEVYAVDRVAPAVSSVDVPADGSYVAGQNLDFTVHFSEAVLVDTSGGMPRIAVTLDTGGTVYASYVGGSGGTALTFRLTVATGQLDATGIALGASLDLNGATVRDAVGNDAAAALNGVPATGGILIDAVAPGVTGVTVPADGLYNAGDVLTFTVGASESVLVDTSGGTPRLVLNIGGVTRYASYVGGSGSGTLVFQYTVQPGDSDADGIVVGGSLDLNGGTVRDPAGNAIDPALGSVPAVGVLIDTTAPAASGIVRLDPNPTAAGSVRFTVTFSEDVSGVNAADFALVGTGSASGTVGTVTQVDARTYTLLVSNVAGAGTLGLNLKASGTGIVDAAGNAVTGGLTGAVYTVDRVAPVVGSVGVPANGSYVAGQNLDFTVNFSEAVVVDTGGGTPRIAVTLDTGGTVYASYVGGSGSTALTFRLTVATGQLDNTGIALGASLDLNGGTVRDALGNDAVAALNGVPATGGIVVDAVAPTVAGVTVPADGRYNAGDVLTFTVGTSENVVVDTSGGTPRLVLNVGGVTRYASYVSGSGGGSLVFQYVIQAGDNDADGITVGGSLDLNGGTVRDPAGNAIDPALGSVPAVGVLIDTTAPAASGIVRLDPSPTAAGSVRFTVTFSEDVSGVDAADFLLAATGSASGSIAGVTQVDAHTYTVLVNGIGGAGTLGLNLKAGGTGIVDAAGNAVAGGLTGAVYAVDRVGPAVTTVSVPGNAAYNAGDVLNFTVNLNEATLVSTAGGVPRLALNVGGQTVYASYVSGSGSSALLFRYIVQAGHNDADGIAVIGLQANGGTLRDAQGNDASLALAGVPGTAGIVIDTVAPQVAGIERVDASPTSATSVRYTVTFSENVFGLNAADFTLVKVGLVSGQVGSVTQVDGHTYTITITGISGAGSIGLNLNAAGSGISDRAGNNLSGITIGQVYVVAALPPVEPPAPAPVIPPSNITVPTIGSDPINLGPITPNIVLSALDGVSGGGIVGGTGSLFGGSPLGGGSTGVFGGLGTLGGSGSIGSPGFSLGVPSSIGVGPRPTDGRPTTLVANESPFFAPSNPAQREPIMARPNLGIQSLQPGQSFGFALPAGTFSQKDPDARVSITVRQANGRPLPSWLQFDPVNGWFSGQVPAGQRQTMVLEIVVRDAQGNQAVSRMEVEFDGGQGRAGQADKLASLLPAGKPALAAQFGQFGHTAFERDLDALLGRSQPRSTEVA